MKISCYSLSNVTPNERNSSIRAICESWLFINLSNMFVSWLSTIFNGNHSPQPSRGTKSGGIGTAFQLTSEDLEVMQEHCEKEHPNECEALMNMRDEDLLDIVSKISSQCY